MKKTAFFLLSASTLLAECDVCCPPSYMCCEQCEMNCCDPCCDRWGVMVDVEFLYWYAKENGLPLATEVAGTLIGTFGDGSLTAYRNTPTSTHYLTSNWDPGFRIGIGFDDPCSCWEVAIYWTSLKSTSSKKFSGLQQLSSSNISEIVPNGATVFLSPWFYGWNFVKILEDANLIVGRGLVASNVSSHWRLHYDMIDLEFGPELAFGDCFFLRPTFGLRGGWTNIRFKNSLEGFNYIVDNMNVATFTTKDSFSNRFSGIGLLAGLEPSCIIGCGFGIYGQLDVALLWGEFKGKWKESFSTVLTDIEFPIQNTYKNRFFGMQGMVDVGLGIRYQDSFCCDNYRLRLDAGWEHRLLVNHVYRSQLHETSLIYSLPVSGSPVSISFADLTDKVTDLVLGGFVLRAQFEF